MDDQDKGKIALRIAFIAETKLAIVLTVLLEKLQKDEVGQFHEITSAFQVSTPNSA